MRQGYLLLLGFTLLGCAPPPRDIALFAPAPAPAQPAQHLPVPLLLAPIDSAPVYTSKDLLYRLGYADNQLHPYGNSSWNASPISLFESVLRQTGGGNLLTLDQSRQLAHCALRVELTSFEQVFTDAQNSHAELGLHFSLMQLLNHQELGHGELHFDVSAQTADARGGALALEEASHQAASQIIEWLNHSLAPAASGSNSVRSACER
jgi:cholesterol transport system auxiliary component